MGVSTIALSVLLAGGGANLQDHPAIGTPGAVTTPVPEVAAQPLPDVAPTIHAPAPPAGTPPPGSVPAAEDENVIIVSSSPRQIEADPFSGVNAASFAVVEAVDKVVVAPVAGTYERVVPKPIRNGLRNFLINLAEPIVFVNYLLQFKPGKAMETAGRFVINSTVGVAGLFDMAKRKPFRLPYRENGFANTFAYHGIGNGPYLFLPVLGPTTARDLVGRVLDLAALPTLVGKPFNKPVYGLSTGIVKSMNDRVAFDEQIKANRAAADPYVATRDFYLKRRQAEVDALHSPEYRARKGIAEPVVGDKPLPEPSAQKP